MPERGKNLGGGFPRLTALKVEEVTPDSHLYMLCKQMVVEIHEKYPGSVRVCLFYRLRQKAAMEFGHGLFCKYSNIQVLTLRSRDLPINQYVRILDHAILILIMGLVHAAGTTYSNHIISDYFTEQNRFDTQKC